MYFFYDFPDNSIVKNECCLLDFVSPEIKSRFFNRENIKLGHKFSKIDNDNARLGYEILEGPKSLMTEQYIKDHENKMLKYMLG